MGVRLNGFAYLGNKNRLLRGLYSDVNHDVLLRTNDYKRLQAKLNSYQPNSGLD